MKTAQVRQCSVFSYQMQIPCDERASSRFLVSTWFSTLKTYVPCCMFWIITDYTNTVGCYRNYLSHNFSFTCAAWNIVFFVWFTWPSFVNNKYPVSNMNSKALSFMYDGVGLHYITFLWYQAHRLTEVWELSVRLLDPCNMYVIMYVYNIKNHVVIICK